MGTGMLSSNGASTSGAWRAATISASCSIEPDSLKSLKTGFLSSLFSTLLDNWERAITGTSNSRARVFSFLDISYTSCCLDPAYFEEESINCR